MPLKKIECELNKFASGERFVRTSADVENLTGNKMFRKQLIEHGYRPIGSDEVYGRIFVSGNNGQAISQGKAEQLMEIVELTNVTCHGIANHGAEAVDGGGHIRGGVEYELFRFEFRLLVGAQETTRHCGLFVTLSGAVAYHIDGTEVSKFLERTALPGEAEQAAGTLQIGGARLIERSRETDIGGTVDDLP